MSNRYLGKVKFSDNKKNKNDIYKNEDILNFELMNNSGIYIFLSPSKKTAYVGKSLNVFDRLKTHIRDTFICFNGNTNSHKVLSEQDVEMYHCFSINNYDYSNIDDISKELDILEGIVIDAVENSGFSTVNKNKVYYDISDLKSDSFNEYKDEIELGDNLFRFSLKDVLIHKTAYTKEEYISEMDMLRARVSELENKIDEANVKYNDILKLNKDKELEIKQLKIKLENTNKEKMLQIKKLKDRISNNKKDNTSLKEENKLYNEYLDMIERKNIEYLVDIKNKNTNLNKDILNKELSSIIDLNAFEDTLKTKYLSTHLESFTKELSNIKTFKVASYINNYLTDELSLIALNMDYSKAFTEYDFIKYIRYKQNLLMIFFMEYSKCEDDYLRYCILNLYGFVYLDYVKEFSKKLKDKVLDSL